MTRARAPGQTLSTLRVWAIRDGLRVPGEARAMRHRLCGGPTAQATRPPTRGGSALPGFFTAEAAAQPPAATKCLAIAQE